MTEDIMTDIPVIEGISIADLHRDPTGIYARLRREAPVALMKSTGRVLLTKAEDVRRAKEDLDTFTSEDTTTPAERAFQATSMMRKDGPQHRAERMAMAPGLSAGKIKTTWRALSERLTGEYLDKLAGADRAELFTELAAPYAGAILGEVLGLHGASADDVVRWSQVLIDGAGNVAGDEEVFARSDAVNDEINALIDENMARFRTDPDDSVLSAMTNAKAPLDLERIRCNIKVAIGGGVNEPRDALLTAVFGLLTNPDQRDAAVADPALMARAFEEGIRWVAPIQTSPRKTLKPVVMSGIELPAGTRVSTIQASANHDEDLYEHPERFDIFRSEERHFSFGNGSHFCMGTHLSRMSVAQVMLPALFERFPNMALVDADAVEWYGFTFRGPLALDVTL
jgi:cytochrome P450